MYIIVSPFSKTFDDLWLIYYVPDFLINDIKVWQIVEIPIKDIIEIWVVLKLLENIYDYEIDETKIKSLISIKNPNIFLSKFRIELVFWIANYYFTPIHNSLNLFFPKNLRDKILKDKLKQNLDSDFSEKKWVYEYTFDNKILLSTEQNKVYNQIIESKKNKILFYWLTGSWKTEIYINLIKEYLDKWKQILFLIPEIILTNQLSKKINKVFWDKVIIINSTVTDANKTKYWLDINNSNAKIIIWTRSAIFYPYNNLWLIIIDEEHDNSYISDSAPRYNTIEVAEKITELNWNKLILASGTPSIKSMYRALKGEYSLVNLLEKYIDFTKL